MLITLHGNTVQHSNVLTDVHIASITGYQGIEIHSGKLLRYLINGGSAAQLKAVLDQHEIYPAAIDIIGDVEVQEPQRRREILDLSRYLCGIAAEIGCPTIQLNAFNALDHLSWNQLLRETADNIAEIADIGKEYGIRFQYEGAAWTRICSLSDCLKLLESVDRPNVGLLVDYWHFWAQGDTTPEQLSRIPAELIYGVHICDGTRTDNAEDLKYENEYRGYFPGEGELPVDLWTDAVISTGYDGIVSGEIMSDRLWEYDNIEMARNMCVKLKEYTSATHA